MAFALDNPARGRTVRLCVEKCWQVLFACKNAHSGGFTVAQLADRFAPEVTLEQIAERLRCTRCGANEGMLTILQDPDATRTRDLAKYEEDVRTGRKK